MKYNPDDFVVTVDGKECEPMDTNQDSDGWEKMCRYKLGIRSDDGPLIVSKGSVVKFSNGDKFVCVDAENQEFEKMLGGGVKNESAAQEIRQATLDRNA